MIPLLATTDIIRTTTSSAATLDIVLHYVEANASTGAFAGVGRAVAALSSATSNDTLAGPGGTGFRTLKTGSWRNRDASLADDVTVAYRTAGPVDYELHKVTLKPGETLEYIEGIGFFTLKPAAGLDVLKIMASDSVHATAATFADITGLTQALLSGLRYSVLACLFTTNNASTTGSQFGYNIGAAPTAALFGEIGAVTNSVTAAAFGSGTATARDTAIVAQTTGQTATGIHLIGGFVQPSADGTFAMRATSEITVAAGLTVKAGSWMRIIQER